MKAVINRVAAGTAEESQVRFALSFDGLFGMEKDTELGQMYELWQQASKAWSGAPNHRLVESMPAAFQTVTIIDVSPDNPHNFLVERHALRSGFDFCEGLNLGEFPSRMNRDSLLVEYLLTKSTARPHYDEIHQWRGCISRHYTRVTLPLCNTDGAVTRLIVAARMLRPDQLSRSVTAPVVAQ